MDSKSVKAYYQRTQVSSFSQSQSHSKLNPVMTFDWQDIHLFNVEQQRKKWHEQISNMLTISHQTTNNLQVRPSLLSSQSTLSDLSLIIQHLHSASFQLKKELQTHRKKI